MKLLLWLVVGLCLVGFSHGGFLDSVKSFFGFGNNELKESGRSTSTKTKQDRSEFNLVDTKVNVEHQNGVSVVDFSRPVPKLRVGARVCDLMHGLHFDSILQDTPDEIRPPSAVLFYDSADEKCMEGFDEIGWDQVAETELPARERLFTARYDVFAAPRRTWFKFIPEHDLAKRFGVDTKSGPCPRLAFVPKTCSGFLEYCVRKVDGDITYLGCEDFKDPCKGMVKLWDGKGDMVSWLKNEIEKDGVPRLNRFFQTYYEQGVWMRHREYTTSVTHLRNAYLSVAFPAFTTTGFKAMETPKEFQEWLLGFYARNEKYRRFENWQAESTQMSFHEVPTGFVDLDREYHVRHEMANKYIKPIVEEWSGVKPLELTAFYGMREYPDGSFLRNHVDRIDTHVLSVTITVKKLDEDKANANPWPLEVVQWTGDHVRYDHPGGTMVLYESSKLAHGRPYPNQGGTHVGCFIHFKPAKMHTSDAKVWDDIAQQARNFQNRFTGYRHWRSSPSVEEENPVYASTNYGELSEWKHVSQQQTSNDDDVEDDDDYEEDDDVEDPEDEDDDDDDDDDDEEEEEEEETPPRRTREPQKMLVTFRNDADRTLDLNWMSHDGRVVPQGTLGAGAHVEINTFEDHRFFFAERGQDKPLPGGMFTMERGRKIYKYDLTASGAKKQPSKWADFVREKLKNERDSPSKY